MLTIQASSSVLAKRALVRLSEKWTAAVIHALADRPMAYGILRREIGISAKVLTVTLRALERDGFVLRVAAPSARLQVTYELTSLGRSLLTLLGTVEAWARDHATDATIDRVPVARAPDVRRSKPRDTPQGSVAPLDARPTHLCLAVDGLERAAATFSTLFGVKPGPMSYGTITAPDRTQGQIGRCAFRVANFIIELIQPVAGSSSFGDFLRRAGQGVHHIGLRTRSQFDDQFDLLEQRGGRRTLGSVDDQYALFDFNAQFGATLEIVMPHVDEVSAVATPEARAEDALAHHALSHIGILVQDVKDAASAYADVLGVGVSPLRTITPAFPDDAPATADAAARLVTIRQGGISILLIEPVGSSPWRDWVETRGNGLHHVSFNVGGQFDGIVRTLQRRGARQVLGRPGVGYAQFDFMQEFGLVVGLIGTSAH